MSTIIADNLCEICLGTGWNKDDPKVVGRNADGSDMLEEGKTFLCRCVHKVRDENEDAGMDIENEDEDDGRLLGGALIFA